VLVQAAGQHRLSCPDGSDRLADPADARPWLIDNTLLAPAEGDRRATTCGWSGTWREALRALLVHKRPHGPRARGAQVMAPLAHGRGGKRQGPAPLASMTGGEILLAATGGSVREQAGRAAPDHSRLPARRPAWEAGSRPARTTNASGAFYDRSLANHGGNLVRRWRRVRKTSSRNR